MVQAGLIDGGMYGVPSLNALLVLVDYRNSDMGVVEGNDSRSRATWRFVSLRTLDCDLHMAVRLTNVASANAADVASWWCPGRSVEQRGRQRPGGTLGLHSGDPRLLIRSLKDGTEGQVASWGRWRSGDVETNVVPQIECRGQLMGHCFVASVSPRDRR